MAEQIINQPPKEYVLLNKAHTETVATGKPTKHVLVKDASTAAEISTTPNGSTETVAKASQYVLLDDAVVTVAATATADGANTEVDGRPTKYALLNRASTESKATATQYVLVQDTVSQVVAAADGATEIVGKPTQFALLRQSATETKATAKQFVLVDNQASRVVATPDGSTEVTAVAKPVQYALLKSVAGPTGGVTGGSLSTRRITLHDGHSMPVLGLGTFSRARCQKTLKLRGGGLSDAEKVADAREADEFRHAVLQAVKCGYRLIDSAQLYRTEGVVGDALTQLFAAQLVRRDEVFITTKVATFVSAEETAASIDASLAALNLEYLDLVLIHSPHSRNEAGQRGLDVVQKYRTLHEFVARGQIRSVGVSNFSVDHLTKLELACPDLPRPVCNQIELSPFLQEVGIIEYCAKKGIVVQAYSPLGRAKAEIVENDVVKTLASKHSKSWAQILLRWQVESGFACVAKSANALRIASNGDIFDFALSASDMHALDELSKHEVRVSWNPLTVEWDDITPPKRRVRLTDRDKIAEPLQSAAKSLDRQQKTDAVAKGMRRRGDSLSLQRKGILQNQGIANSLQATRNQLDKNLKTDTLSKNMAARTHEQQLYVSGIKKHAGVADGLHASASLLEQQQLRDRVQKSMRTRTADSRSALENAGILRHGEQIADSLQSAATQLQHHQTRDTLRGQLRNRMEQDELRTRGIYVEVDEHDASLEQETQNIINGLSADELSHLKATLERDMRECEDRSALDVSIFLQDILADDMAEELQNANKQRLSESLQRRVHSKELADRGILVAPNQSQMADSLQATAKRLQQAQKSDRLAQNLSTRRDKDELAGKGILEGRDGVAHSLQATAQVLAAQQKRDTLKAALLQQSSVAELEQKGILYQPNMASSLQANAKVLEAQLSALQHKNKSSVAQTKLLQTLSRQQKDTISNLQHMVRQRDDTIERQHAIDQFSPKDADDIERCLSVLSSLNHEIASFEATYNRIKVDEIGDADLDELVHPNSVFNVKIDKYAEIAKAMKVCVANFEKSVAGVKQYVREKYIPNVHRYESWDVNEIILWVESLEYGRFTKYLKLLIRGLKESEIENGVDLPDLTTADLSVTPFEMKSFRDKRDLVKHFRGLREKGDDDQDRDRAQYNNIDEDGTMYGSPSPNWKLTQRIANSIKRSDMIQMTLGSDNNNNNNSNNNHEQAKGNQGTVFVD